MAVFYDTLSGKRLIAVPFSEADAGRQHLANGAYDSVPYTLIDAVWADGTVSQAIDAVELSGGQLQRTITIKPDGSTLVSGKLNHPHIP